MPPLKKKRRLSCLNENKEIRNNDALSHKQHKKSSNKQQTYEVAEILSTY